MAWKYKYASAQPGQPRKSLYGEAETGKWGGIIHADKFGTDLTMRSAEPPPVSAYDEWLKRPSNRRSPTYNHRINLTGFRLRRIVVMRRAGASWKECGDAVGVTGSTARKWVDFLPKELGA